MVESVIAYKANDGSVFSTKADAAMHDIQCEITKANNSKSIFYQGSDTAVYDFMKKHPQLIIDKLKEFT